MQTITEYVVRKQVTILGKDYAPGDRIDDPNIKPGVLATLVNTKRIGTQVRVQPDFTATTITVPQPDDLIEHVDPGSVDDVAAAPGEPEQSPLLKAWRAQYDSEPHGRGGSFRVWLCQQAGSRKIRSNGSNEDIASRLDLAGFKPGDPT